MTGAAKAKGDRAEREAADLLTLMLGHRVRRLLGAGRSDDTGDLDGVSGFAVQVADWKDALRAVRQKPTDADTQAQNSGLPYGVAMVRLRGGEFRMVLTPETFAKIVNDLSRTEARAG